MCGIAGFVGDSERGLVDTCFLTDAVSHRGPDGLSVEQLPGVYLGHSRLAINGGAIGGQPVADENEIIWATTNGEIYNASELTRTLRAKGHRFDPSCDTNLMPALFKEFGFDMFDMIDGPFATAIWDTGHRTLVLARDRFGEKPLFYRKSADGLYFCSEAVPLQRLPGTDRRLDPKALRDVATTWGILGARTAFPGVKSVERASYVVVEDANITVHKYHRHSFTVDNFGNETVLVDALDELLLKTVSRLLECDVSFGVYLSGGLDSSLLAAMATKVLNEPPPSFSIQFPNQTQNEREFQERVANAIGSYHRTIEYPSENLLVDFCFGIKYVGSPLTRFGYAPMMALARLTKNAGISVVLSGEGADELFGGYDLFKEVLIREACEQSDHPEEEAALYRDVNTFQSGGVATSDRALAMFYNQVRSTEPFASHALRFKKRRFCEQFLSQTVRDEIGDYSSEKSLIEIVGSTFTGMSALQRAQWLEGYTLLSGYLLRAQGDAAAMSHAIEARYPFLTRNVAEFAAGLPDEWKVREMQEKYLLKRVAERYLPAEVISRKKFPYRALLSPDTLAKSTMTQRYLSDEALTDLEIFDARAVSRFVAVCMRKQVLGENDLMALAFIFSVQALGQAIQ